MLWYILVNIPWENYLKPFSQVNVVKLFFSFAMVSWRLSRISGLYIDCFFRVITAITVTAMAMVGMVVGVVMVVDGEKIKCPISAGDCALSTTIP
jgi:hypothetical protein